MKKTTLIWVIVASLFVVVGLLMFVSAMSVLDWDFKKLSTSEFQTNNFEINDDFVNIQIDTDTDDIVFLLSGDGTCKVVCEEYKHQLHSVEVIGETLVIKENDERKWYGHIGIFFGSSKITVYLPENEYSSLNIEESTGYINVPSDFMFENVDITASTGCIKINASASESMSIETDTGAVSVNDAKVGSLDVTVSTGTVELSSLACDGNLTVSVSTGITQIKDVTCKSFNTKGSTGDVSMTNVKAHEKFTITRSTGDVEFENCDASEVSIKTDTGDVEGSFSSEKIIYTKTDTGDVSVPKSSSGGVCEIETDTGDIEIRIK